jgi:PKD repeat protein
MIFLKKYCAILMFITFVAFISASISAADVIIDNGGAGTSYTGSWALSGGTSPYGGSSLWSRNGATYTYTMSGQPPGTYEVLMWWSGWSSRPSSVPVAINYTGATANLIVNQKQNAGQWNSLGTFFFDGSGSVRITAANGDTLSTCADAVQFRFVSSNTPPVAVIDSIVPSPADVGENVTFTGHGTDPDGTIIAYEWVSSIDGTIGTAESFSTASLSSGTHVISFRVKDDANVWSPAVTNQLIVGTPSVEVIIDNGDAGTSYTGSWPVSGATGAYGANSVWSRNGTTYTWTMSGQPAGTYEVSMWWSGYSSRASSVPVAINYSGGVSNTTVNQKQNAGQWNILGTFYFDGTGSVMITAANGDTTSTCADAVKFVLKSTNLPPVASIDSITPNPAQLGQNVTFTGHGTDPDGTVAAYEWTSSIDGSIGNAESFAISTLSAGNHTISLRVRDNQNLWSTAVTAALVIQGGNTAPTAVIDSITPSPATPGQVVTFTGHGTDADGSITAYEWSSSIDGIIGTAGTFSLTTLSSGTHTISFRVKDNGNVWSAPVTAQLTIGVPATEVIIDNGAPGTSYTGNWAVSGGSGSYGAASVWSRNGATYTFAMNGQPAGTYTVSMWWSAYSTRATSVPVAINYAGGTSNTTVNQRVNGSQWNSLGTFYFNGTGSVVITAANGDTVSTCADGVKFTLISSNVPPVATIDSITPSPADPGQSVTFTGHGTDQNGSVTGYEWSSSKDGIIGTSASFSSSTLSAGVHTITFRVMDNENVWSQAATASLTIGSVPPSEVIIDNTSPQTSRTGTWSNSAASGYYGTNSVWSRDGATFSWKFTPAATGYYDVSMWWTTTSTRSSSIPVSIVHSGGTQNVTINQLQNAGKWNSLGTYQFIAGTTYNITIISQANPTSTCADAVKFSPAALSAPTADFSAANTWGTKPFTVQFTDNSQGIITSWLWNFGDGGTSTDQNPSHTYASSGTYTVALTVANDAGSNTKTSSNYIHVEVTGEHIYLCDAYTKDALFIPNAKTVVQDLGGNVSGDIWTYTNSKTGKTFFLHTVEDPVSMAAALKTEGAHIIFNGHGNFGLGATFATPEEIALQEISTIRYINDDRFTNFSSDMVSVKVDGVQYGQAYPNWLPIYKDGTSGIMPYRFSEGLPPYNYYLTYKLPGDETIYKVELEDGRNLERFPDSATPAWFSPSSAKPDQVLNPEYFIVNNDSDFNRCDFVGTWPFEKVQGGGYMGEDGYLGYNYQYHAAGTGANTATWTLVVNYPGLYAVLASWKANASNASNAKYTVNHAAGSDVVTVDQRVSDFVNTLGVYYFNKGVYKVSLSDNANGRVIADAVVLSAVDNPQKIFQAEFDANVLAGASPLSVQFTDYSGYYNMADTTASITQWQWNFGNGATSTLQNPAHTYSAPGVYTVSLTATDSTGASDTETKTGFIAVGQSAPLRAQFTSASRMGSDRTVVKFDDQSSGNITGWLWDFGDGATSTEQNPVHAYTITGTYSVSLTVTGPDGSSTETETDFIHNIIGLVYADNTAHHKPHFYSRITGSPITFGKVILDTRSVKIPDADMKYSRMFYGSRNSCSYYGGTFQRGIFYCTTGDSDSYTALDYLKSYLQGASDEQLLYTVNSIQPIHHIVDFSRLPPSMR